MAAKYRSTLESECWKEHVCVGCGTTYRYLFKQKVTGTASSSQVAAEILAEKRLKAALDNEVELHPCPACGMYQPDMIGDSHATGHGCLLVVVAIVLVILLVVGIFVADGFILSPVAYSVITWVAVGLCTISAAVHILIARINHNRDFEANRKKAQEEIDRQKLRLERAGHPELSLSESPSHGAGIGHWLAFIVMFAGIGAIMSAEITRLTSGWPLNRNCDPMVVGPGDNPRIYLPNQLKCVGEHWKGTPTVTIANGSELGLSSGPVEATSRKDTWGTFVKGKSHDMQLWVQVPIPDRTELAGKTLQLDIKLAVDYAASTGPFGFENAKTTCEYKTEVLLASPHAGPRLSSVVVGWSGNRRSAGTADKLCAEAIGHPGEAECLAVASNSHAGR